MLHAADLADTEDAVSEKVTLVSFSQSSRLPEEWTIVVAGVTLLLAGQCLPSGVDAHKHINDVPDLAIHFDYWDFVARDSMLLAGTAQPIPIRPIRIFVAGQLRFGREATAHVACEPQNRFEALFTVDHVEYEMTIFLPAI